MTEYLKLPTENKMWVAYMVNIKNKLNKPTILKNFSLFAQTLSGSAEFLATFSYLVSKDNNLERLSIISKTDTGLPDPTLKKVSNLFEFSIKYLADKKCI